MSLIDVKELTITYPDGTVAVEKISFSLEKGEIIGVIGESGSGKSTLGLAMMKLFPEGTKISGEIVFQEKNIIDLSETDLEQIRGKEIGMVFQDTLTSLDPLIRIGKQIVERPVRDRKMTYSEAFPKAIEIMQDLGVTQPQTRMVAYPHELSGGLRQRAFITMTLFQDPKVLIFDEPTTSLDVVAQSQFVMLLKKLREQGFSMIFITHDILLASSFCDKILIMYSSKMMEYGATDLIIGKPSHPYTKGLLEATPRISDIDRQLKPMKGFIPNPKEAPSGCRFWPRCDYAKDICKTEEPKEVVLDDNRRSYCNFAEEVVKLE